MNLNELKAAAKQATEYECCYDPECKCFLCLATPAVVRKLISVVEAAKEVGKWLIRDEHSLPLIDALKELES